MENRERCVAIVGFNGDGPTTGFATRVLNIVNQASEHFDLVLLIKFYPIFHEHRSWALALSHLENVRVIEVPSLPISRFRILRFFAVPLARLLFRLITWRYRPALIQAECHEAAAIALNCVDGVPVFVDLHGAVPEEAAYVRRKHKQHDFSIVRWLDRVERDVVCAADKIIVVSDNMVTHLNKKWNTAIDGKSVTLPVGFGVEFNSSVNKIKAKAELGLSCSTVFLYSGGTQHYQCLAEMLSWFAALRTRMDRLHLLLLTPDVVGMAKIVGQVNIPSEYVTIKSVTKECLPAVMDAADFGFVLREDEVLNRVACPTKIGEYLAREVRIICTDTSGHGPAMIKQFRAGVVVPLSPTEQDVETAVEFFSTPAMADFSAIRDVLGSGKFNSVLAELYKS